MSISEQDWQAATDAIAEAGVAVISCHIHPDGDALGSALALFGPLYGAQRMLERGSPSESPGSLL